MGRVKQLRPISYTHADWGDLSKADDIERWGFIAHELQETLIDSAANGHKDAENVIQSPNPWTLIAALTPPCRRPGPHRGAGGEMIRTLHLNPVEAAPLSARSPMGFDMVMDLVYRTAANKTVGFDLAGALVLEGRTSGRSQTYLAPASDVVNGKARVFVPGGDLQDSNGYRMTLVGTVDGARRVIATGTLVLSGSGTEAVTAADVIDTVPLLLTRGQAADLTVNLWQDAGKTTEYGIGSSTVSAAVYATQGGLVLVPFTVAVIDNNTVNLSLASMEVDALPDSCWWSLAVSSGGGVTTLAEGPVTVT